MQHVMVRTLPILHGDILQLQLDEPLEIAATYNIFQGHISTMPLRSMCSFGALLCLV
jgi:hypothetical protein